MTPRLSLSRLPLVLSGAILLVACQPAMTPQTGVSAPLATEPATQTRADWRLRGQGMAAAADPRAVDAAAAVLARGGHAVDAAIAAHAVLGLVEPQSSGIGGGGFMLVYNRDDDTLFFYDGRETAPAGAMPDMFMRDGKPLRFVEAWQSGRSVGVPGAIALYKATHEAYGKRPWAELFEPAINLAENGFEVTPRLADMLPRMAQFTRLDENPGANTYFYPDGQPLGVGTMRKNPEYAATLRAVAAEGPSAFYAGPVAEAIVAAAQAEPLGGSLSLEDIAAYTVTKRYAVCVPALDHTICSSPPPGSGGVALGQFIQFQAQNASPDDDEATRWAKHARALQLAYADRDHYVADADFVTVPVKDLIDPRYITARLAADTDMTREAQPGDPGAALHGTPYIDMWGQDPTNDAPGTTHLSIVDIYGNAVSMTMTVEAPFGSSRWAAGFLLNNELTDFSFVPTKAGKPVANAVAPGKRPRSSMSPSLVFDAKGDLFMVTGSPGGNSIISYVAKTLSAVLLWDMDAQTAVNLPNVVARGPIVRVESAYGGTEIAALLKAKGFTVEETEGENSGLHVIIARQAAFEGGADPRREGKAVSVTVRSKAAN